MESGKPNNIPVESNGANIKYTLPYANSVIEPFLTVAENGSQQAMVSQEACAKAIADNEKAMSGIMLASPQMQSSYSSSIVYSTRAMMLSAESAYQAQSSACEALASAIHTVEKEYEKLSQRRSALSAEIAELNRSAAELRQAYNQASTNRNNTNNDAYGTDEAKKLLTALETAYKKHELNRKLGQYLSKTEENLDYLKQAEAEAKERLDEIMKLNHQAREGLKGVQELFKANPEQFQELARTLKEQGPAKLTQETTTEPVQPERELELLKIDTDQFHDHEDVIDVYHEPAAAQQEEEAPYPVQPEENPAAAAEPELELLHISPEAYEPPREVQGDIIDIYQGPAVGVSPETVATAAEVEQVMVSAEPFGTQENIIDVYQEPAEENSGNAGVAVTPTEQEQASADQPKEAEKSWATGFFRSGIWNTVWSYVKIIIVAFLIAFVLRAYVFDITMVDGLSMFPTLDNHDKLLTAKITYRISDPRRGDIVVVNAPDMPGHDYIKRIIGMPNEQISITDGEVYINGELLIEPYLQNVVTYGDVDMVIPDGYYFVMGDNRTDSRDSRETKIGVISRDDINSKAVTRLLPLDSFGSLYK